MDTRRESGEPSQSSESEKKDQLVKDLTYQVVAGRVRSRDLIKMCKRERARIL